VVCGQSGDLKRAIPEETKKMEKYPRNFQCPIAAEGIRMGNPPKFTRMINSRPEDLNVESSGRESY
jgi:hypothetical protein